MLTSSYHVDHHAQRDGRRYVRERHVEGDGTVHEYLYLAADGTDYQAILDARAASILAMLADAEFAALIGEDTE